MTRRLDRNHNHRSFASVADLEALPRVGQQLHGFTLKRLKQVPELEITALHLQHEKTGAEYLHIARDDSNNVFSIGFKTNPPDATGVPHILEHTTLCGSKRYPVRDPFFKMLRRSLSNFMNAFTSSDHTSYPFATTNAQDFRNLMSVYMDATLHPLLKSSDFTQEGWRIGPANPLADTNETDTASNDLVFKGVVYNEMKGQMSDASYLYYIRFQDHMFPAINNSGGDPQHITSLTWEQLKQFHADHYHPSNAKIFTYGNMPLVEHLKEINERLSPFDRIAVDNDVKSPISLEAGPLYITVKGPTDPLTPPDMQNKTSISWIMGDSTNIVESFSLGVLSSLLLDGYGSPLYRGLIETGLGTDWSPNTGFDNAGKTGVFSVGLNGVKEDDIAKVKEAIFATLEDVREKGFDEIKVNGILHQLELGLKHKTANFGMGVMQRLNTGWFNGVDPLASLAWNDTVAAFKTEYAKGGYLEGLVDKYLLNDRTLTFTMEPSEVYGTELAQEEHDRLASKILETTKSFSSEEDAHRYLKEREIELLEVQEKARGEDLSSLPTVHVKDIPRAKEQKTIRESTVDGIKVQWREADTNGLTYFRGVNTFDGLSDSLRELMPLFSDSIMRLGTKDKSMEQLEELIKLNTGGISIAYHSATSPNDTQTVQEGLAFSGYALDQNIIIETDFDSVEAERKIRQLLQASASGAINSRFTEAGLTPGGKFAEQTGASRLGSESFGDIIRKLKAIQSFAITNTSSLRVALTCGKESSTNNEAALQHFLSSLPRTRQSLESTRAQQSFPRNTKSFFPLPYQVYYSALAVPTVPYDHVSGASLAVLSQLLTHKHLHHEIREKGGAYGGGAYASALNGVFGYYSYRDPNPQNTVKIMGEAGAWARDQEWTGSDLEEAKLSVFQSVDAPRSVSDEGMSQFLSGVDQDMQQRRREQLLDVSKRDVQEAAEEFLVKRMGRESNLTVLGEKKPWVKAGEGWEVRDLKMVEKVEMAVEQMETSASA
ncbi:hypothetical protein EJ05DRAFT_492652 [Pseudovirgaria hyperparasitica]|uniref:Presequence protease, mitochondrial n=1 Tax=Pseudovirgaria hyperparasitica TaxID=470096 RepID=A0A6A6W9I4_9PEZI|nr:uncharacterized protein EJ05DRAFT_492652 [Pseudovirgaria hyperparasitica]KAF2759333.1 hypothetical protein EJ05DRAFT_492652 [Pseudovirgaria hyperparasitica]